MTQTPPCCSIPECLVQQADVQEHEADMDSAGITCLQGDTGQV